VSIRSRIALALFMTVMAASSAFAQPPATDDIIGYEGASQLSFATSLSAFSTTGFEVSPSGQISESSKMAGFYYGTWDFGYFLTNHVVLTVGNQFNGMLNGPPGLKPTLNLLGGGLYYFTPSAKTSPYVGGKYLVAVSNRPDGDAGNVLGYVGIQKQVRGRTSLFGEVGYGGAVKEFGSGVVSLAVGVRVRLF
jgi:hypothetical protein